MATGLADDVMADNGDGLNFAECLSIELFGSDPAKNVSLQESCWLDGTKKGGCVIHAPNLVETGWTITNNAKLTKPRWIGYQDE